MSVEDALKSLENLKNYDPRKSKNKINIFLLFHILSITIKKVCCLKKNG